MAQYNVQHTCGHEYTHILFGSYKDREWRLERLAETICPECQKAAKLNTLNLFEEENNLHELGGSEKQISWARDIRFQTFKAIEKVKSLAQCGEAIKMVEGWISFLAKQESSKWWIDNRYELPSSSDTDKFTIQKMVELTK